MSPSDHTSLDRRLLLFTGKGGVGKSSVVAGLATHLATRGRRPLIVELGHRASMEAIFAGPQIGYEARPVGGGVWAMNVEFDHALSDYLAEHVRVKRLARAIVDNDTLQRFFRAAPSVAEVATLNKISSLVAAHDRGGHRWDPVLVDLDATGHALMLLALPAVLDGLIGDGPMRRLVDGFSELLGDAERTALHLVTLPKELPAQETIELHEQLRREAVVSLGMLFVNQVPEPPLAPELVRVLGELHARAQAAGEHELLEELALADRARAAHAAAAAQIERLRATIELPVVELPLLAAGIGPAGVARFGELIAARVADASARAKDGRRG